MELLQHCKKNVLGASGQMTFTNPSTLPNTLGRSMTFLLQKQWMISLLRKTFNVQISQIWDFGRSVQYSSCGVNKFSIGLE